MERLLSIKEVSNILDVTKSTLRIWDNNNKLKAIKTIGGHRKYKMSDIDNFLNG